MKSIGLKSIILSVMFVLAIILSAHFPSYAADTTSPDTVTPSSVQPTNEVAPTKDNTALDTQAQAPTSSALSTLASDETSAPNQTATITAPTTTKADAATANVQTKQPVDTVPLAAPATTAKNNTNTSATTQATSSDANTSHKILHTNDMHGRMVEEQGRVLGMAKLKTLKEQEKPDLLVDAGDAFQGLPLSNQSKGEEMAQAMNAVGYDAMTAGNHEFDFGYDQLKKLEGMLNFPIVSSNVYKDGKLAFKPSVTTTKNGIRYGIIGVTTPETQTKTSPNGIKGVTFADPLASVTREMNRLNGQVDVFVVLSHLGIDPSTKKEWRGDYLTEQLSQNTNYPHPIFVIDGHSHTVIEHGQTFNQDILAQTGTALANVGKITFQKVGNQIEKPTASLIHVKDLAQLQPDAAVKAQIDKANAVFLKATSEVIIPNNTVDFQGERDDVRTHETNLGNAITDAMEAYGQKGFSRPSDFAVTNSGGIRASIAKGKVTLNDVITVLPFGNTIAQISVKGSDVWKAFEHSLSAPTMTKDGKSQLSANGGLLQVSKSIKVYFDMQNEPGQRIRAIQVLNKKTGQFENLDLDRTYAVATNDFTASGGDGFSMFVGPREEGISLEQVFANYLKTADISMYDTTSAERLINGMPPQNNAAQPAASSQPTKVIPFPKTHPAATAVTPTITTATAVSAPTVGHHHATELMTGKEMAHMQNTMASHHMTMHSTMCHENMHHANGSEHAHQLPQTGTTTSQPIIGGLLMVGLGIAMVRRRKHSA